jgi:hypothetical protein
LRLSGVLAVLLVLGACQTRVETQLRVSDGALAGKIRIEFAGDAAALDAATLDEIRALVAERAPEAEVRVEEGAETVIELTGPIEVLTKHGGLTGVSAATVEAAGDEWDVSVQMQVPAELIAAISKGVEGEADAAALVRAALGSTSVGVYVQFSNVTSASYTTSTGERYAALVDGGGASWSFDLAEPRAGVLEVRGSERKGPGVNVFALGGAALLFAGVVVGVKRKRR